MVPKAVPIAQQQHGLAFHFFSGHAVAAGQRMRARHGGHKRLVIQRRNGQVTVGERLRQNGAIDVAVTQLFEQFYREVFLQNQGHLRCAGNDFAHQLRQQIRPNGVDHSEPQAACQRVFAALGDFLDVVGLFQHALCLPNNLFAQRCHGNFVGIALKELDLQFIFKFFNRHA